MGWTVSKHGECSKCGGLYRITEDATNRVSYIESLGYSNGRSISNHWVIATGKVYRITASAVKCACYRFDILCPLCWLWHMEVYVAYPLIYPILDEYRIIRNPPAPLTKYGEQYEIYRECVSSHSRWFHIVHRHSLSPVNSPSFTSTRLFHSDSIYPHLFQHNIPISKVTLPIFVIPNGFKI